ncbi:MAG: glycosyltransferase [Zetaproteobacteria bacterium]|nr:MAG: glycosyltransferase [Zetaproteobacteria bacterium]
MKISIITAIHNGIEVNKLFLESLRKNSRLPYELIIVDNHSTDGSTELFEQAGAIVIRRQENHCYPESQNLGMRHASGEVLAFLNNDIYLAPDWDQYAVEAMRMHGLDIVGLGSFEVLEDPRRRLKYARRWRWLRRRKRHVRMNAEQLRRIMNRLYGRQGFEAWAKKEAAAQRPHVFRGLNGSAVLTTRRFWDIFEAWDERIEAADWDIHIRAAKRAEEVGDIQPPMIIPWALHHHFSRMTFYAQPEPRACDHPHLRIDEKWPAEAIRKYGPRLPEDTSWRARWRRWIKSLRPTKSPSREQVQ